MNERSTSMNQTLGMIIENHDYKSVENNKPRNIILQKFDQGDYEI